MTDEDEWENSPLAKLQRADSERLKKIPAETRKKWADDLRDAALKFNDDPEIKKISEVRIAQAVEAITAALAKVTYVENDGYRYSGSEQELKSFLGEYHISLSSFYDI